MKTDQGLEAVRKARSEISRELGNDPARLIAHYLELQKGFSGRLLLGPEGDAAAEPADAPFLTAPGSAVHV